MNFCHIIFNDDIHEILTTIFEIICFKKSIELCNTFNTTIFFLIFILFNFLGFLSNKDMPTPSYLITIINSFEIQQFSQKSVKNQHFPQRYCHLEYIPGDWVVHTKVLYVGYTTTR